MAHLIQKDADVVALVAQIVGMTLFGQATISHFDFPLRCIVVHLKHEDCLCWRRIWGEQVDTIFPGSDAKAVTHITIKAAEECWTPDYVSCRNLRRESSIRIWAGIRYDKAHS